MHGIRLIIAGCMGIAAAASSTTCISSALTNPTPLTPYKNGVATKSIKVGNAVEPNNAITRKIEVPFPVGIYENRRKTVYVFGDGTLETSPHHESGYTLWDVLTLKHYEIVKGRNHGVFYSIEGKAPNRTANFEWRLGRKTSKHPDATWHFGIQYYEDQELSRFKFWNVPEPVFVGGNKDFADHIVFVEYYRGYYFGGLPDYIQTGDVLILPTDHNDPKFEIGPLNACEYEEGSENH